GGAAGREHAAEVAGDLEADQAELFEGVDDDDLAASALELEERGHEARVVAGGGGAGGGGGGNPPLVAGFLDVVEGDGGGAGAGDAGEADAAGLVAEEGAVVDVVGAVEAGEELEEKAGFVGGAAAEVEEGVVGGGGLQGLCDFGEGLVPGDGAVGVVAWGGEEGFDEAAAVLELPRGEAGELVETELVEEAGADAALHVGGHGLDGLF